MYHIEATEAGVPLAERFPHHESVKSLWLKKWRILCSRGLYPFENGDIQDFEPIFQQLIQLSDGGSSILYDPDSYAAPFIPVAEKLVETAAAAESKGNTTEAAELYLRAAAVYRIARFPIIRTRLLEQVWERQKEAFRRAGKYMTPELREIEIPFSHSDPRKGDTTKPIQACLRIPEGKPLSTAGHPPLLFICGLDYYRTDNTKRYDRHLKDGFAVIAFEIPGTGDCPASKEDPESPDRILSSVLDWVYENGAELGFDLDKICARGISTGGYYAMRAAHTHADRLHSVVAQGGGSHHMFEEAWIQKQNQMEYPFALADALAYKFGYESVEAYAKDDNARDRYSLISGKGRVVEKPSCRMLVVNGVEDSIFPSEDSVLVAMKGLNKDLSLHANLGHMGAPIGENLVFEWLAKRVSGMA